MNFKRFLRDFEKGTTDLTIAGAMEFLELNHHQVRTLVRRGILTPVNHERGKLLFFSHKDLKALQNRLKSYR